MFPIFIGGVGVGKYRGREKGWRTGDPFIFIFTERGSTITLIASSPERYILIVCNSIQDCPVEFQNEKVFFPFDK